MKQVYFKLTLICFLFLFLVISISPVFSSSISLSLSNEPNEYVENSSIPNKFYVSNFQEKVVCFNVNIVDENNKEKIVKFNFQAYNNNDNINIYLSKYEDYLINLNKTSFCLYFVTNNSDFDKLKLRVDASLYDKYENLISRDYIYLEFISNNVNYAYLINNSKPPVFEGYEFSRNVAYILNDKDNDVINIKLFSDIDYAYNLFCKSNKKEIKTSLIKINNNYDLNIFFNKDYNSEKEVNGEITCFIDDTFKQVKLKPITVSYIGQKVIVQQENKKSITNFTLLSTIKEHLSDYKYLFMAILFAIIVLLLFK